MHISAKRLAHLLVLSILVLPLGLLILHLAFMVKASQSTEIISCQQVWAHRGAHTEHPENSLAAFTAAFEQGTRGVELDVHFDSQSNQFVVSHDAIAQQALANALTLEAVFAKLGGAGYYWLDFKNLVDLSQIQRLQALAELEQLIKAFDVPKSHLIVESIAIDGLVIFTQADFITSYWLTLNDELSPLSYGNYAFRIKAKYLLGQFRVISTDINNYTDNFGIHFPQIPTLLFTVNEPSLINALFTEARVRVILTDHGAPATFDLCQGAIAK